MFFHPKNLESENNNPWFKLWFNISLHTQSIVCATVDSQCLKYLGYITLQNVLLWWKGWMGTLIGLVKNEIMVHKTKVKKKY